jgi:hypothetical protein
MSHIKKTADGTFVGKMEKPAELDKVLFKFVVDGDWLVSPDFPVETDKEGNLNNVFVFDKGTFTISENIG